MKKIIRELCELGFTRTEAGVYLNMLKTGDETAYQMARSLGISRSSVYSALDNLNEKGAVFLIPGDKKIYQAEDPQLLISRIRKEVLERTDRLFDELSHLTINRDINQFLNIEGRENIVEKARMIIREAEKEILINTDFPASLFAHEFEDVAIRGVRILLFSFHPLVVKNLPIEFYYSQPEKKMGGEGQSRLMISVDSQMAMIAGKGEGEPLRGTFSQNKLLTSIVAEHIHHDIYLLRLREKYGHNPSEKKISLGTLHEKLSGFKRLKPTADGRKKRKCQ